MSTRFDYRNLGKQCRECNHFEGGKPYHYSIHIDRTWGAGTAALLYKLSQKLKNWDIKELEQIAAAANMGSLFQTTLRRYNIKLFRFDESLDSL